MRKWGWKGTRKRKEIGSDGGQVADVRGAPALLKSMSDSVPDRRHAFPSSQLHPLCCFVSSKSARGSASPFSTHEGFSLRPLKLPWLRLFRLQSDLKVLTLEGALEGQLSRGTCPAISLLDTRWARKSKTHRMLWPKKLKKIHVHSSRNPEQLNGLWGTERGRGKG